MPLLPRESAKLIAGLSKHVTISDKDCEVAHNLIIKAFVDGKVGVKNYKSHPLHPTDDTQTSAVNWIFLVDTLNFSFWSDPPQKYEVTYQGKTHTGYWSLCAAVNRAIEEGYNIISPAYYSSVSLDTLQHIFRSDSGTEIPLLKQRHKILNETGQILLEKFGGTFLKCLQLCQNNAQKLLELIVDSFPSYRDESVIDNYKVSFYKRAQILIGDLWCCCEGRGYGAFDDIDSITIFADYRVPQVLVYLGVLTYSDELEEILRKGELIENGSRYEVEIRGCTIWAVELITNYVKEQQKKGAIPKDIQVNSILIDNFLWDYRRQHVQEMEHIPFHRTRCIFY